MSSGSESSVSVEAECSPSSVAGLILAAGESSRMGCDKALLKYRGRTFLENIVDALHAAEIGRVVVVLGHHAQDIRGAVNLAGCEVVVNPDYHLGQTSSLQAGLRALAANEPGGIILCLVDHPAVAASTLRRLIQAFLSSGKPVVMPVFQSQRGHPVVLAREVLTDLLSLGLECGANTVIRKYGARTEFVEVTDPGVLLDVDDPESYRELTTHA